MQPIEDSEWVVSGEDMAELRKLAAKLAADQQITYDQRRSIAASIAAICYRGARLPPDWYQKL
jgi:hypothetical protein